MEKEEKESKYPFIIHGCATPDEPCATCGEIHSEIYPTHTHGLEDIGWPEFLINGRCFGPRGNARTINESYDYFSAHPEKLESVLNGEIVKLSEEDLAGNETEEKLRCCYRLVEPKFAAVKLAYPGMPAGNRPFIQIWVEGDDFALEDGYYLSGEDRDWAEGD